MTDVELLKQKILESGLKVTFIAKECGLSPQGFYNKRDGKTEFTQSEIIGLKKLLKLTSEEVEEIFFTIEVDKAST